MKGFEKTALESFPGLQKEDDFVRQSVAVLQPHGFSATNSIALVGGCRDELCRSLARAVQQSWGEAFDCSSLAGMLLLGRTGFMAAHHHSPVVDGRERYIYFAFAHIALGPQGEQGACVREGREGASTACGALVAFWEELKKGKLDLTLDPDDLEQGLLKDRLLGQLDWGDLPDLLGLTQAAHGAIRKDLKRAIGLTVNIEKADYAVFTGIQVHGPDGQYVWCDSPYAVVRGEKIPLSL